MCNLAGGIYGYLGLFPIATSTDCLAFRRHLRELDQHQQGSPLSAVPIIHMARFVIIDETFFQDSPAQLDRLASRYLLFACNFDGTDVAELAQMLFANAAPLVQSVWSQCFGYKPDTAGDLTKYFTTCQIDINLYFSLQQDANVANILRALQLKRLFSDFVERNQLASPAALQASFGTFWAGYQGSSPPGPGTL